MRYRYHSMIGPVLGRDLRLHPLYDPNNPPAPPPPASPAPSAGQNTSGQNTSGQNTALPDVRGLLDRHNGDAMAVIATLLSENHSLRAERRELRARLPGEGAVVLSGEQAQAWQAYTALGAPDALQQQLQQATTAAQRLAALERERAIGEAAAVAGFKPSVLAQLPGAADLTFEVSEVEQNGTKIKVASVKDKDGKMTPLIEYAKEHWPDFLPALTATQSATGARLIPQNVGTTPGNLLDSYIAAAQKRRDSAPNPFKR